MVFFFNVRAAKQSLGARSCGKDLTHFFEYKANTDGAFDQTAIVASSIENGHHALLLDSTTLPREFLELSSGVLRALFHRLTLYDIRMAVVIPDTTVYSRPFQDFIKEANRGKQFYFAPTREKAVNRLEKA